MNIEKPLQLLEQHIAALSKKSAPLTDCATWQACFDPVLFNRHSTRLPDYLLEIRNNLAQLKQMVAENRSAPVAFLAEKLVAQIAALQRELATRPLRQSNQPSRPVEQDIYHKLAEHQDYERRLTAMIQDRENLLKLPMPLSEQQQREQELVALAARLTRCRQALQQIERDIERKEHAFYQSLAPDDDLFGAHQAPSGESPSTFGASTILKLY